MCELLVSKAVIAVICYDYMIQKRQVACLQGLVQSSGGLNVRIPWHGVAGRMVVDQDYSVRLPFQCLSYDYPVVQDGGVQSSDTDSFLGDKVVGSVEEKNPAFFMVYASQQRQHHAEYGLR